MRIINRTSKYIGQKMSNPALKRFFIKSDICQVLRIQSNVNADFEGCDFQEDVDFNRF